METFIKLSHAEKQARRNARVENKSFVVISMSAEHLHDKPDTVYEVISFDSWLEQCKLAGAPIQSVYCAHNGTRNQDAVEREREEAIAAREQGLA